MNAYQHQQDSRSLLLLYTALGVVLVSTITTTPSWGAELSSPTYSYLTSATYSGQNRNPASWGTIKTTDLSSTLYPLCASTLQQSPISLSQYPNAVFNPLSSHLTHLAEMVDAGWPSDATLTGLTLTKPGDYATVTALYLQKLVTGCTWWSDGAELRLKNFDRNLQFVDPSTLYSSSIPIAYRTKTLEAINFVVGSAHTIGGERRDLEIQYVFATDSSVSAESEAMGVPVTTIVSVTATAGMYTSNTLLGKLLSYLTFTSLVPATTPLSTASTSTVTELDGIDLMQFLPASTSYFTYEGSETSPPCRRARWFVFKEAIPVALHQIAFIREKLGLSVSTALSDSTNSAPSSYTTLQGNYRPLREVLSTTSTSSIGLAFYEDVSINTPLARQRDTNGPHYTTLLTQSIVAILMAVIGCAIASYAAYTNWTRRVIAVDHDLGGARADKADSLAVGGADGSGGQVGGKGLLVGHSLALGSSANIPPKRVNTSDPSGDDDDDDDEDGD